MKKPKFSVIIPVYNVEDYLFELLTSILKQTLIEDIEVLLIDDGSTDNSKYIIEEYALDYDNFYAYHKINEGQGIARNYGLKFAKGEYIHFMDSDDYIPPNFYEKIYSIANEKNLDFITVNGEKFGRYNVWDEYLFIRAFEKINDGTEINLNEYPSLLWDTSPCNKLYKRSFLISNDLKFPPKKIFFEDLIFSLKSYVYADNVYFLKNTFYGWRRRGNSTSTTQNIADVQLVKDRIEITNMSYDFVKERFDDKLRDELFLKWLTHDLSMLLGRIPLYLPEFHKEFLEEINKILSFIPDYLFDNLNSYRKIIFQMVKDNNLEGLLYFAPLKEDLQKNPIIPEGLDEKYKKMIDFEKDSLDEKLVVTKLDIDYDNEFIFIDFDEKINFLAEDYPHKTNFTLIDNENNRYPLEFRQNKNKQIIVPITLIKNKNNMRIECEYVSNNFIKKNFLKSNSRRSIEFDGFDVDFGIIQNNVFLLNTRELNDNLILIDDIIFDNETFHFKGRVKDKIKNILIENVIYFNKITYPVNFTDIEDIHEDYNYYIDFSIPFVDILNTNIKKWEIKTDSIFNSIKLNKKFEFYKGNNMIVFNNARHKILIEEDICDLFERLDFLNGEIEKFTNDNKVLRQEKKKLVNENTRLIEKNSKLSKDNQRLKERIEEYKSRKVVRLADKFKF